MNIKIFMPGLIGKTAITSLRSQTITERVGNKYIATVFAHVKLFFFPLVLTFSLDHKLLEMSMLFPQNYKQAQLNPVETDLIKIPEAKKKENKGPETSMAAQVLNLLTCLICMTRHVIWSLWEKKKICL